VCARRQRPLRDFLDGHDPERRCRQAEYLQLARHAVSAAGSSPPCRSDAEADGIALEQFPISDPTVLTRREPGLACSLIAMYRGRRLRSPHVGAVGQWLDAVVLVARVAEQPSARHVASRRHDLIGADGNRLVCLADAWNLTPGRARGPPA
jgi:hypothetical protein